MVALVLLLKAAVPMLAAASAQAQGRALADVCTVYGVVTVVSAVPGSDEPRGPTSKEHAAGHVGDPCALTALTASAAPAPRDAVVQRPARCHVDKPQTAGPQPHDPLDRWLSRLEHGPPIGA